MNKIRAFDHNLTTDEIKELMAEYLTLYSVVFKISEACVEESKCHKDPFMTIDDIREYLSEL
jgi:hypothetical protein